MNKKELIAKLLDKLTEEDLEELLGAEDEPTPKKRERGGEHVIDSSKPNRRRGSGKRKKNKKGRGKPKSGHPRREKKDFGRKSQMDLDSERENRFDKFLHKVSLDQGETAEMAAARQADEEARKASSFRKTARPSTLVDVKCHVCHEEETVSASLVKNAKRYKCNDCSGSACG